MKVEVQAVGEIKPRQSPRLPLRATLDFQQQIHKFFYYQNHIVCKCDQSILIYNTLTKTKEMVKIVGEDFMLVQLPPYLFAVFQDRFIHGYRMGVHQLQQPVHIRISKLQPRAICRFNKGYFLGGFNRSFLPGNRRSKTRDIYYIEQFKTEEKNKADYTIRLRDSVFPVSMLQVQNPYLFAYCNPVFYLISIKTSSILITFEKEATSMLLLEGRFAMSSVNGIGVSKKNTLFGFDVEKHPIYGVEVIETKYDCEMVCMQKTGRIFGVRGNQVFQYHPLRQQMVCVVKYSQGQMIRWICCTPSNSLMVLRYGVKGFCSMDVYGLQ